MRYFMNHSLSQRNPAMDVVRCVALFSVNSVHFFLHTGFYDAYMVGSILYLFMLVRTASLVCVPLFLLLSGYLMKNKVASHQYYRKLIKIVSLYMMASGCCYLYSNGLSGTLLSFLLETFDYTAAPYSWYMEMYFGLFLLIPYLNTLYKGLPTKKSRSGLILTLLIMTAFTEIINCFHISTEYVWTATNNSAVIQTFLPDWWQGIYPLTYYFLGAYLKDYPIKLSTRNNLLFFLLAVFINGTLNYFACYGGVFVHGPWQSWGSILNVTQSVLLFKLLAGIEFKCLAGKPIRILSRISELSLGAFLVSWIFDDLIYTVLTRFQPVTVYQLPWYPVTTFAVFLASLYLAWILDKLYHFLTRTITSLYRIKHPA